MTARRKIAAAAVVVGTPLMLTVLAASPAYAHGSMQNPVSRIAGCFAEGPEHPRSAACRALVAAGGTQPLYDWNEVNIANAAAQHKKLIPDGKLCSANRDKYKGLDLPRADWPATKVKAGSFTFSYKATAPHKGTFDLYITKDGYNPSKPLKWSDLTAKPFASVTNPQLKNGAYVFGGTMPKKSGRHLIYAIWQRSDSPEAFYSCSDVVFGKSSGAPAPQASAPTTTQMEQGASRSTVDHAGHGGDGAGSHGTGGHNTGGHGTGGDGKDARTAQAKKAPAGAEADKNAANAPVPNGESATPVSDGNLAQTGGGSSSSLPLAVAGATFVVLGSTALVLSRRRGAAGGR
ncbi:lytic polysaccharide monooxygenase auxiliary activity family 9 protein [Wenjunlia tyrosinilytica]|uniref:Chitin-binding protein n=1 Tax=Wenjunlia tyrosinilytica TaxID=1544741 RepID=A0A917ZXC7_9ACTN|nr:lytic polysaccharide monooxygenase [Wenjunlia tyrosinilytica]GGO95414.1 chitin-binding protein [Wenjunlia tyrosinilytica]